MPVDPTLPNRLAELVGREHVLSGAGLERYERDCTGRFGAAAALVVRPADAAQTAAALALCAEHGAPVVPQGGNTGLVGGGVPRGGEVLLSLARLDGLEEVDRAAGQLTAGAGATLAALQRAARAAELDAGMDFAARERCTLGGVVACDAGGPRALRHGTARARLAGMEAALADGTLISRLSGLLKDNAGYDLPALLAGSEGTLGVITRVRWRLVAALPARATALVPLSGGEGAGELLGALRAHAPSLESCELIADEALQLVLSHVGWRSPAAAVAPLYALVECAAREDPVAELADALAAAQLERETVLAVDPAGRARLWELRERLPEAIAAAGIPHKLDVGVPPAQLARFIAHLREQVAGAGGRALLFGHLGDGNVHVNVLGPAPDDERVDDLVLQLALDCGGTISAEHGVGIAKARWLERARGASELGAMRAIKRALDPRGVLNPGVVLPSGEPSGQAAPPARM
jgi:FAD/FMN-containing dehydrogenase